MIEWVGGILFGAWVWWLVVSNIPRATPKNEDEVDFWMIK